MLLIRVVLFNIVLSLMLNILHSLQFMSKNISLSNCNTQVYIFGLATSNIRNDITLVCSGVVKRIAQPTKVQNLGTKEMRVPADYSPFQINISKYWQNARTNKNTASNI